MNNPPLVRTWREEFTFLGTGGEYFRIWIVNILLTVLTLGIYSAWAKVRRMHFFYRNTRLAGASFDYHGDPIAILKGRIIATLMLGSYYGTSALSPVAGIVVFFLLIGAAPWLISRSLRFRFYHTSYRGLRFRFTGTTADAYKVFLLFPIATILTLGTLAPMWHQRLKQYLHSNAWYGRTQFSFDAPVGSFYRVYFAALGLLLAFVVAGTLLVAPIIVGALRGGGTPTAAIGFTIGVMCAMVLYLLASVSMWAFTTARVQNLAWNHTQLGPHRFVSAIQARQLVMITITNLLGVVFTLGFFKPFAVVRVTEYLLNASTVVVAGNLNEFVAGEQIAIGAAGEEAAEMFDIDIAV
jgi:uncharacterized membrane protein YjgN (DUF898 family)